MRIYRERPARRIQDRNEHMFRIIQIFAVLMLFHMVIGCDTGFFKKNTNNEFVQYQVAGSVFTVEIRGSSRFIEQTRNALNLLEKSAPDALHKVQKYVGIIELGKHSAMWAYSDPPRFEVNERTAYYSDTWFASVIAHEATHSELFHDYHAKNSGKVPDKVWKESEAEVFCKKYQLDVLKRLGAPANEINHLTVDSNDGTHCDIDRDGDCDWFDYWKRNW